MVADRNQSSYIFKVQFMRGVWRKIKISSMDTLHELHLAIQDAYDFDNDHLYGFFMDGKRWSNIDSYWSPENDEGPFANRKELSSFHFVKGFKFLYLFDFGDEWKFTVSFDKEIEEDTQIPVVVESRGEAPEQYPDYDEDEEEEE